MNPFCLSLYCTAALCISLSLSLLSLCVYVSIQDKSELSEEQLPGLTEILGDETLAASVLKVILQCNFAIYVCIHSCTSPAWTIVSVIVEFCYSLLLAGDT